MKTFSDEVRVSMLEASYGYCQCTKHCGRTAEQAHHIVPNTKVNRKLYPLFIQSPFNLRYLNHICHLNKPLPEKPNETTLKVYEEYLQTRGAE